MDLYRYFHPHYSPRLKHTPLRLQEVYELTLAAQELKRAIERAELRFTNSPIIGVKQTQFNEILITINSLVDLLSEVSSAHPGDSHEAMEAMIKERTDSPGWESWVHLLKQRLNTSNIY